MERRRLMPMDAKQNCSPEQDDLDCKVTDSPRHEERCFAQKHTSCAMESNNNSNAESNHYSRLLGENMSSSECNGPERGDRRLIALPLLELETAEKWSQRQQEDYLMSSSSPENQSNNSPSHAIDPSLSGDELLNLHSSCSPADVNLSPVHHSYTQHSHSRSVVQSTQSTPTVSHRESFKRAKSAPSISPNSPMSRLVVKHPEKKLVRRQSSPPGALNKENNSLSIGSKFRRTIFKRITGHYRDDSSNNVQTVSSNRKEKDGRDGKKTKRGFHSFSSSPQLCSRLSDANSNSLQGIHREDLAASDVETRSLQEQPRKAKSIAKEIKARVQSLRRRHTEGSLQETEDKVSPENKTVPDAEDIKKWAEGFESLLKDKLGLEAFRKFLQTEFSDENIEFWLACEEYKNQKPSKMVARAHKIYEDYVTIQAPREVNLDSRTRLQVVSNLSHPNKHSFEQAQKRIEALMEKDSYPRFLRSEIFLKIQKAAKKNK